MQRVVSIASEKCDAPRVRAALDLSIIIPLYNEEGNVDRLVERLFGALCKLGRSFEVIAVNDGSCDRTMEKLRHYATVHHELVIIDLRRNSGQTAAIMAGIDHSSGEVIVTIDADLQNDPDDIEVLLAKLDEGYDVVSGWRKDRKDAAIRRNFVSRVANRLISKVSGVSLNDYGCTLKVYRRDVLRGVRLYGEMHRFVPIYASWMGARVVEMPVRHYPRVAGQSKYGLERIFKVLLDLIVIKFLDRYLVKPIYIFGGFGLLALLISFISGSATLYLKLFEGVSMISTPLPLLTVMTFLVGFMSVLMGLLAEMLVRTYFESQSRASYMVRELINFPDQD